MQTNRPRPTIADRFTDIERDAREFERLQKGAAGYRKRGQEDQEESIRNKANGIAERILGKIRRLGAALNGEAIHAAAKEERYRASIRALRLALYEYAEPEEGWRAAEHADAFEASREIVPLSAEEQLELDRLDRERALRDPDGPDPHRCKACGVSPCDCGFALPENCERCAGCRAANRLAPTRGVEWIGGQS